jgi:predicted Zn-dependent protease
LSLSYFTSHYKSDRQIILLNRTIPDFHQLFNIEKQKSQGVPPGSLKEYFDYFNLVTGAMPDNSDGMLVMGYLKAITGHASQAGVFFKAAYRLDPQFFFTEFNLGFWLFEHGEYAQSAQLLQKALTIPPQETWQRMMNSIVYRQILATKDDSFDMAVSLQQAYHDAYIVLLGDVAGQKKAQKEEFDGEVHAHIL